MARKTGIARSTLERWIRQGKVRPEVVRIGKRTFRLWSDKEIKKVKEVKAKTYRKGRGRKKQKK